MELSSPRKQVLLDTMGLMNTCTHSDCGIRHKSKPYRIPALKSEVNTIPYPLPRSYLQMITTHKGKICFLVQQSYWIYEEHLRADIKTKRIVFLELCFMFVLFCLIMFCLDIFFPYWTFAYISWSLFLCFYGIFYL